MHPEELTYSDIREIPEEVSTKCDLIICTFRGKHQTIGEISLMVSKELKPGEEFSQELVSLAADELMQNTLKMLNFEFTSSLIRPINTQDFRFNLYFEDGSVYEKD